MKEPSMYAGIYVKNVPKTANIFKRVLNADVRQLQPNLLELTLGKGRLILSQQEMNETGNTATSTNNHSAGKELELGIWVDNLDDVYQKVVIITQTDKDAEISFISDIESKNSGIKDFRFRLSEGYYVRVTSSST